jgi:hypothetical protein
LNLDGGAKGLLQNSESLCKVDPTAIQSLVGQNGIVTVRKAAPIATACGSAKKAKRHRHAQRAEGGGR